MASIYDIATIQAGDPLGAARDAAKEASVAFEQYQHQKDIIEDVNRAIEDAKKESKKGIFGSSLLGSLIPQLINSAIGATNPLLAAAIAGIGAGGAEKIRQDKVDATGELEKLKEKYKGREIAQDIDATIDTFEDAEKQRLMSNIISSAGSEYLTFGDSEYITSEISPETTTVDLSFPSNVVDPDKINFRKPDLTTSISTVPDPLAGATYTGLVEDLKKKSIDAGGYGDILGALGINVSDDQIEKVLGKLPFLESSTMANLIRTLGPAAFTELMAPKPVVSPYQRPQFRNPFRGGY